MLSVGPLRSVHSKPLTLLDVSSNVNVSSKVNFLGTHLEVTLLSFTVNGPLDEFTSVH